MSGYKMQPHCLDLGPPQLLQTTLMLVFRQRLDQVLLKQAFWQLLVTHPVLRMRLNILRTGYFPSSDLQECWKIGYADKRLREYFSRDKSGAWQLTPGGRNGIHELFRFSDSWWFRINPPAIQIRLVLLEDGCLMNFVVQHSLCDATGMLDILHEYVALLRGKPIGLRSQRPQSLRLKKEVNGKRKALPNSGELLTAFKDQYGFGILGLVWYGLLTWIYLLFRHSNPRSEQTVHVPGSVIDRVSELALEKEIKVTRNDLLMATLLQASQKVFGQGNFAFGFVLSVRKDLDCPEDTLHNPWWVILLPSHIMNRSRSEKKCLNPQARILELASKIREIIIVSRSPDCMRAFLAHYENQGMLPIYPRTAPHFPNIIVSSSNQLNFQSLGFPDENGRYVRPGYVELDVQMSSYILEWGLNHNDVVTTLSDGLGGFYVHGTCHMELWEELRRCTSCPT
ncbi:hypothetical protein P170DRAFT_471572 [Aspergillus steynii IBT 23096]|uniref:Uncharacterized protein n=1 Tax=Aspergillus steynii IBT 23096 TaxID=1392250 RepID=A0A2I2GFI6_9EURO|nr:uncharacterized protein P170DRAFT_471572 [Aspergillus steynii IBT 23096]PLB51642.1 hypothetical protein P170DRAFT_471572 [Aspergillus steynii IBT 23096]